IAKERYKGQQSSMLSVDEIINLEYKTSATRCNGCSNRCMLTINHFSGGRKHITGNRCERGAGKTDSALKGKNLFAYKLARIFKYEPLPEEKAPRGVIGIPRVLNMYENYPYWATFFTQLGFSVKLSPMSTRKVYELGMETIPSESECYPAKLSHGHVQWLIDKGITTIFHPCVFYERQETKKAQNHFNCPIVVSYPENLKNNIESITDGNVRYIRPFMAFTSEDVAADRLVKLCAEEWGIPAKEVRKAAKMAWDEQLKAKADIVAQGREALEKMEAEGRRGIVIVGRPYHIDPEINHGIPELVASYGLDVFTEDSIPVDFEPTRPLRANDQWTYHSRLYNAAEFVCKRNDLELIQLNSFGCGLDAVTTDEVCEILENCNKLYTVLKIDEVNNLGAVRIRIRSLLAAMGIRDEHEISCAPADITYKRAEFTKEMFNEGYTILAPQMSPIHFDLIEPLFKKHGYNIELLRNDNRSAIDVGLKYVNNDACFPSITVVGQIMSAVLSGKYNTDKLAIIMTQTGGCCRASNYIGFIRRALDKVGLSHIPVISLNMNGMETNEGFNLGYTVLFDIVKAAVYGDLLMKCLYRVRPYEKVKHSANALHEKWRDICVAYLVGKSKKYSHKDICKGIVEDFDALPIDESIIKPKVGIVGEILVKYMPLANNNLVDLLEKEGAEAVVPDILDFLNYSFYNSTYKRDYLGGSSFIAFATKVGIKAIQRFRKPAIEALKNSKRFEPPMPIAEIAELAKPLISIGNQYGEGWLLAGEMAELITHGTPNIVCIQPFACLPNHVVGKGVLKQLRKLYPNANVVAVDYDPGASEVNQLNRIKLMLSVAKNRIEETKGEAVKS
ncbi:MAG: 2-hydroxyacyl-CoA dehydratase, partial [Clostridia bacterium]|nr:2-hydroxyacyl-CoA dehydratase [Clostridia bacterium]